MSPIDAIRVLAKFCLVLACGILLPVSCGCAQEAGGGNGEAKTIEALGVGATRDDATTDAQVKAIEQGLGLYIKSETLVQNLALVSDTIHKESHGFLLKYDVLNEQTENGLVKVKIKAVVAYKILEGLIDELYDQLKIMGNPRIILQIEGTDSLKDPDGVKNALTEALVEKGFKVLDSEQLNSVQQRDAIRMLRNEEADPSLIQKLSGTADVIITGKVSLETERVQLPGGGEANTAPFSARVTLNAKVICVDTAQILAAKRAVGVGVAFTAKAAQEKAEDSAGAQYYTNNKKTVIRFALDPCKEYTVKLIQCPFERLTAVKAKIDATRFTRQAETQFEENYGTITVLFAGNATQLATALAAVSSTPKLKIAAVTKFTITAKLME